MSSYSYPTPTRLPIPPSSNEVSIGVSLIGLLLFSAFLMPLAPALVLLLRGALAGVIVTESIPLFLTVTGGLLQSAAETIVTDTPLLSKLAVLVLVQF